MVRKPEKPKHINRFRDRHGKLRDVCRVPGQKSFTLPGLPWSEDYMAAYSAALARIPNMEIGADRTLPGTIDALVVSHYRSAEWNALEPDTQKTRRRIIEKFRAKHGEKRVGLLHRDHVLRMLAEI